MPPTMPAIESRLDFTARLVAAYIVYAALCSAMVWYMLYHQPAAILLIAAAILIGAGSVILVGWTLRMWGRRFRESTRAFYSDRSAGIGTHRRLRGLSRTLSEAMITISGRGLQLAQGGPVISWASLDRIRETRSWIIFMRDGRRLCALPKSRIAPEGAERIGGIFDAARPQLGGSRRG